jgi:hypothetical protein
MRTVSSSSGFGQDRHFAGAGRLAVGALYANAEPVKFLMQLLVADQLNPHFASCHYNLNTAKLTSSAEAAM